jgi:hypothetical protein
MKPDIVASESKAVEAAKRELRFLPVPWYEFEIAAEGVSRAHPSADGKDLVSLIVKAVLHEWSTGIGS